jgi:hypothetical protein
VLCIRGDDERLAKENLLHFRLRYAILLVLSRIPFIPVEPENTREIHQVIMYVSGIYRQLEVALPYLDSGLSDGESHPSQWGREG